MKPPVSLERAKAMIQGWYNQYCRTYEKPVIELEIIEEDDKVSGAYKVMNPQNRTLLRVSVDDAESADDIFTTLMGDKVEPRREFIQNHALEVSELDI